MPFVGRAACRRCQFEPDTLVVDPRHWVSPGSLRLSGLGQKRGTFRRAGACPRRPREFTAAPTNFHRTKAFPLGGRWAGEAGSDEGCSVNITTSGKKSTFSPLISQKSKIFASFPPGGSLLTCPVRYTAVDGKKSFPRGEGGSPQARRMRNGETFQYGCTKTKRTQEGKPSNLALPLGELSPKVTERAATLYAGGSEKSPLRLVYAVCSLSAEKAGLSNSRENVRKTTYWVDICLTKRV